jgi:hypothetical protein
LYQYADGTPATFTRANTVFVKYMDAAGASRFALVTNTTKSAPAALFTVRTTDEVGALADPAAYTGTWTVVYNGGAPDAASSRLKFV